MNNQREITLFASGEYKELKSDSKRFKKGETYYILSLVGLIGLVLYLSGVFASPLVALVVVLAFDFMDDEFGWARIGALLGTVLALGILLVHSTQEKQEEDGGT